MSLSPDRVEWLMNLLGECEDQESRLNDWERKFTDDFRSKLEQYGEHIRMSPAQLRKLQEIEKKLNG